MTATHPVRRPAAGLYDRMNEGSPGAEPPQRLNQPATEYFVGGRDLTRWSGSAAGSWPSSCTCRATSPPTPSWS